MMLRILTGSLLTAFIGSTLACGSSSKASFPFQAHIAAFNSGSSGYSLQTVRYQTLNNIDTMDGDVASILGNAAINGEMEISEVLAPSDPDDVYIDVGEPVDLDYEVRGGVVYPRNFDSMVMLGTYYTYENVIAYWRTNLGLDLADFGKLRLFHAPRIKAESQGISITQKLNAAFFPGPRDFLLFRTSSYESIPLNINFGVMAHEFGHAIFDYQFAKKDAFTYLTDSDTANEQLDGINEGLADFFSFMVTGKTDDFGQSLAELAAERIPPVSWTYSTLLDAEANGTCNGGFYCKGSILASALYEIATSNGQSLLNVGKVVYAALDSFRADWLANRNDSLFDYHYLIKRIVEEAGTDNQTTYCTSCKKWFDKEPVLSNMGC
jgi:hypothetical protein